MVMDERMALGTQTRIRLFQQGAGHVELAPDHHLFESVRVRNRAERQTAPSLDEIFEVLSNARRRWVCRFLEGSPDGFELGWIAECIAAVENDVDLRQVSSDERKRVYISLYQCHLPKMDAFGAVRFDADRKTIWPGRYLETFVAGLESIERLLRSAGDQ